MNFTIFDYDSYHDAFMQAISELVLSLEASDDEDSKAALEKINAMVGIMDVMNKVNADHKADNSKHINAAEISQIGDYALSLLDEIAMLTVKRGLQDAMLEVQRLSLPIALWIAAHQGKISQLEVIVNAIATYANELKDAQELTQLCAVIGKIINASSDELKQDIEAADPMRPWRIINLNWGIVATRSYQPELMEQVFAQLAENIPLEAAQFFAEGMLQMDKIDYPDNIRVVMKKYYQLWSGEGHLH